MDVRVEFSEFETVMGNITFLCWYIVCVAASYSFNSLSGYQKPWDVQRYWPLLPNSWYCDIQFICFVMCDWGRTSQLQLKKLSLFVFHFLVLLSLYVCLSSSSLGDDFTEPRNLKLSPGLQSASEKPINSSFKPFILCACDVHVRGGLASGSLSLASSL